MADNIAAINTGLPTENTYDTTSANISDIGSSQTGFKQVDPGTTAEIGRLDESAKNRAHNSADINIGFNTTPILARYLFIDMNTGTNTIASEEFMKQAYMQKGAGSIFFTKA